MKKNSPFPDYSQPCGWNALLKNRARAESLAGSVQCDIAIIGAGYTGIAAARRLAELSPGSEIVLLESSTLGEGNPGRNSGFLLEVALAHDIDPTNIERMRRCNDLLQDTMQSIRNDVAVAGIDCDLKRAGTYRAAAGTPGTTALHRYREFLDASGLPCEILDRDSLAERIGTDFYKSGLYSPHCYLVQPAALIRGLAALLPASVTLYEKTPAIEVTQNANRWTVRTPSGSVSAEKLIVANNAFCKGLGIGGERIVAMYTYAALTEPLDDGALESCGADDEWGLLPAHRLGSTLRKTSDGRLLIRSLYGYEKESDNVRIGELLREALGRRFPTLAKVGFASVWSGATGFTFNAAPLWGEWQPGLFVSTGCNGGGVVKGTLFGKLLAEKALGENTLDVAALFGTASRMPPEPLRWLGFQAIAAYERRRGRAEV